jgi:folate-binding protein YgfZ
MTDTKSFVVDRSPRGAVLVTGGDATTFLQSLVSQDLDGVDDGEGVHSLLLSPQGKLDVDFRAFRVGDSWWLDCDADYGPRLAESLTKFRIRVKADIEDRTASTGMASFVGAAPDGVPEVAHAHRELGGLRIVFTQWPGTRGFDVLGSPEAVAGWVTAVDPSIERLSPEQFEVFRIESGVPRVGVDVDEKTIPQEAGLEVDAVSFTKGCFLGQELVCRIDTRGHVNRYLRRLRVDGRPRVPRGAVIVAGDKEVGAVTSVAQVPDEARTVALGMVRREVEPPSEVTLRWDGGEATATVEALLRQ